MEYILQIKDLTKKYNKKTILDKVCVNFSKGQCTAIIGNNGSGKSTFLKIISGLIPYNRGEILHNPNIKFNYIPEVFYGLSLTVNEYIQSMCEIEHIKKDVYIPLINKFYKEFFLENMKDTRMCNLSKGSLQKVAVIQALLCTPDILLLDEPLSGQDVNSQKNFIKIIKELLNKNVTVIMSCHESFLINELATRIVKIENKKIVEGDVSDCKTHLYKEIIIYKSTKDNLDNLKSYGCTLSEEENTIIIKVPESTSMDVIKKLIDMGIIIKSYM